MYYFGYACPIYGGYFQILIGFSYSDIEGIAGSVGRERLPLLKALHVLGYSTVSILIFQFNDALL